VYCFAASATGPKRPSSLNVAQPAASAANVPAASAHNAPRAHAVEVNGILIAAP
jgi:hypothetical protein